MLETVLNHLHNWFEVRGAMKTGEFRVVSGALDVDGLLEGQYYKIEGSVLNDGLHQYPVSILENETFTGKIWPLAIPRAVIDLADEIACWCKENPETDKVSESFGGYSYSRGAGASGRSGGWAAAFASRLATWRKV